MIDLSNSIELYSNGRLRTIVNGQGQGGLYHDWVALTRYDETSPSKCGPTIYLSEGPKWVALEDAAELADITTKLTIGIALDVDIETRKIEITNHGDINRVIELTSYTEVALNHPLGDAGHPAFSKLFVQTSVTGKHPILVARRRPRGLNENWPAMVQTCVADGASLSWETNRATFLGRGRNPRDPAAMERAGKLSNQTGNVLDPVFALRTQLTFQAGETRTIYFLTGAAADEATAVSMIEDWHAPAAAESLVAQAKNFYESKIAELGINGVSAYRCNAILTQLLSSRRDRQVPTSLSGSDVVHRYPLSWEEFRIVSTAGYAKEATQEIVKALPYWNGLGLKIRLYVMDQEEIVNLPEGITLTDPQSFSVDQLSWWLASAQVVIGGNDVIQPNRASLSQRKNDAAPVDAEALTAELLQNFNGYGGFSLAGDEYVILLHLKNGRLVLPPMPWINVLANEHFGCTLSERGAGYSWARNSQANRLTPWSNDPISDPYGEAVYLSDQASGACWSPLPGPCAPLSPFTVRHGFGRSQFFSNCFDLEQSVEVLVPPNDALKLVTVRIKNTGSAAKNLHFGSYYKLVLGSSPDRHHATLAWTDAQGVQHAANPRAGDFAGGRVFSFVTVSGAEDVRESSGNSTAAFLGAGDMGTPAAMENADGLDASPGFGRDACFARKIAFTLPAGREVQIVIGLGEVMTEMEETDLLSRYQVADSIPKVRQQTSDYWRKMLGHIQIRTPLKEVDLMVNGWLLYQNLACRIWGRSAFYQSGGAYGFRDQLQDSGALAAIHPGLMRSQILLHAAQQFPEGDVTHWWHPHPMNRGMRTKFADDLLWLPYLTDHYVKVTGDDTVFDEFQPFIEGPLLAAGEDEEYMKPVISSRGATVFEHCCLAIDKSLTKGSHGLPLMGIGDWNDGMSRIGREGRGESVWMGFFIYTILERWIPLCENRGEHARGKAYAIYRAELLIALNDAGWDGDWYRRAYYDDGTPLGTHLGDECRIDALAQAWAIISKAAPPDRAEQALDSLKAELVDAEHDIIRLLHPPFVNTPHDPGYIKGYVAGVRENGGQYTHAACWVIRAMVEAGRRDDAAHFLQRLSPVWHSRNPDAVARYQVEPYVVAADIYGAEPHVGRGGWTWYTGSAGWMFRVAVESVLGLRVENGDTLVLDPQVPDTWPGFEIDYRTISGRTLYKITVVIPNGSAGQVDCLVVDDREIALQSSAARWPLLDDGKVHAVTITMC